MSHIAFATARGEALVRGPEREHARALVMKPCTRLFMRLLDLPDSEKLFAGEVLSPPEWVEQEPGLRRNRSIELWLEQDCPYVTVGGEPIGYFELALNTALVAGGPTIRLMAYMTGSCENHGYFAPPHGDLISAIQRGRRHNILREGMGWEGVLALLKSWKGYPEEVVMSYSVTESFAAGEKWEDAIERLREAEWPVDFAEHLTADEPQGYLSGTTVFDLEAELMEERAAR